MTKFKKGLGVALAALMMFFVCFSNMPAYASEALAKINFVGVEHSPLIVGDTEAYSLTAVNADKVQYRAFIYTEKTKSWAELTDGYTEAVDATTPYVIKSANKFESGKYRLSCWVKKAGTTGKYSNSNGDYDTYYTANLNCVEKSDSRVYADGNMDIARDTYILGQKVIVNGIKNIRGMASPYKYKLHIFNNAKFGTKNKVWDGNGWAKDITAYGNNIEWTPSEVGTYVLDVWATSANSKAKYESWKLKTIKVVKGTVLSKNDEVFGSTDAANVKAYENLYVGADKVTVKNVKVNGTIFVDPGKDGATTLDNVEAKEIKVLSGGSNSIHFNNVKATSLVVSSDSKVRIETLGTTKIDNTTVTSYAILDSNGGTFGKVTITKNENGETVVELRGTFTEAIVIEGAATVKAAEGASIAKVEIATSSKTDKVVLDGKFKDVVVSKEATLSLAENTKVATLTATADVKIDAAKGASVDKVVDNGKAVEKTGEGKDNVGQPPVIIIPGGGGGVTPTPANTDALNAQLRVIRSAFDKHNVNNKYVTYTATTDGKKKTVTISNFSYGTKTPQEFLDKAKVKVADPSVEKRLVDVMTKVFGLNITVDGKDLKTIAHQIVPSNNFDGAADYKAFIETAAKKDLNFLKVSAYERLKIKDADINVYGLRVNKITVKDKAVYDVANNDRSVDLKKIKEAIGTTEKAEDLTLNDLKTLKVDVVVELEGGYSYEVIF